MMKFYSFFLICVCCFLISCQTPPVHTKKDAELKSVTDCLFRYKTGYEKSDYELIASCLYPPLNEMILSQGSLLKSKKSLIDIVRKKLGSEYINQNRLNLFAIDPFSIIEPTNYSNIRVYGNRATAVSERKDSSVIQNLAKSEGKWYVVAENGIPQHTEETLKKMKYAVNLINDYSRIVNELGKQISSGRINKENLMATLIKAESKYYSEITSLQKTL